MVHRSKPSSLRQSLLLILATAGWIWALSLAALGQSCAGGASGDPGRYPEKRPEPARSASDGEVLGAHGQSPEDTLEASPTNLHPATGWEEEECVAGADAEKGSTVLLANGKPKRVCPPSPSPSPKP
jgi:hypothetical protein